MRPTTSRPDGRSRDRPTGADNGAAARLTGRRRPQMAYRAAARPRGRQVRYSTGPKRIRELPQRLRRRQHEGERQQQKRRSKRVREQSAHESRARHARVRATAAAAAAGRTRVTTEKRRPLRVRERPQRQRQPERGVPDNAPRWRTGCVDEPADAGVQVSRAMLRVAAIMVAGRI